MSYPSSVALAALFACAAAGLAWGHPQGAVGDWRGPGNGVRSADLKVAPSRDFTEDEVTDAVKRIIAERSKDGVFTLEDAWTGRELALVLDEVRLVRGLRGYGWFPDVVFHEKDNPAKQYALDFWLVGDGDQLKLMDIRVQKEPRPYGQSWVMITRTPLAWWWLPTLQRSSRADVARNWQVMSSIYSYVLGEQKNGVLHVRDTKTGKDLALELVEVLQPVRRLKSDGRFFICAAFREASKEAMYDVDFWVDQKSSTVSVGAVEPRTASLQESATCQVPTSVLTDLYFDEFN
jgi:hypothetical protein